MFMPALLVVLAGVVRLLVCFLLLACLLSGSLACAVHVERFHGGYSCVSRLLHGAFCTTSEPKSVAGRGMRKSTVPCGCARGSRDLCDDRGCCGHPVDGRSSYLRGVTSSFGSHSSTVSTAAPF